MSIIQDETRTSNHSVSYSIRQSSSSSPVVATSGSFDTYEDAVEFLDSHVDDFRPTADGFDTCDIVRVEFTETRRTVIEKIENEISWE